MSSPDHVLFKNLLNSTIVAVYLLILVGGIVRSTGSGMGCPDWPKCFGKWIPPTDVKELPSDYKEVYSNKRKLKNKKIAGYLRMLNLNHLASKIEGESTVYTELDFHPVKTWIEYLNRLTGVIIGLLIFAVAVYSLKYASADFTTTLLSFLSFLIVGFEGWLGSIVVSTNLLPFTVTIHMAFALLLVFILIYLSVRIKSKYHTIQKSKVSFLKPLIIFATLITFFQILTGTQVREEIDIIASSFNYSFRDKWIDQLTFIFKFHRSFSIFVVLLNLIIGFLYFKDNSNPGLTRAVLFLMSVILGEVLIGVVLSYYSIPALFQPLHLILGCLMLGIQSYIFFHLVSDLGFSKKNTNESIS